jgi:hypothetical protein
MKMTIDDAIFFFSLSLSLADGMNAYAKCDSLWFFDFTLPRRRCFLLFLKMGGDERFSSTTSRDDPSVRQRWNMVENAVQKVSIELGITFS